MIPDPIIVDKIKSRIKSRLTGREQTRATHQLIEIVNKRPHLIPTYHISINNFIRRYL